MRRYHAVGFRDLGGALEIEGRWEGVRWIALAALPVLLLGFRSPWMVGAVGIFAVYLFVFPARRRVIVDGARACLRVEHAGLFAERGAISVPFASLTGLVFADAGRRGGQALRAVFAQTREGRVYLFTLAGKAQAQALAARIEALVG